ncbi:uncharacterized protein LOC111015948 isoform X1 [Momordica charantia]|uniref:ADP,ATP carrier protein n=2 Tax=Momordica charantia TaxID=3673 RepID=A0A6J1CYH0_MOMCH|nr:uncharacterized protein LOC111015948 isoform X1 [Momordica charantia]XP_022146844.1 uncharacterized protein LOC111015948 isoform X1 [Momordica charantia]XP_022146845.1 uncharacterized protein LOC111015948 isoform X1 [Momordica charantia]XP_022146846.1 uncharacterized protein LOC111015948 isoform X1 [Momordica charantia]
MMSIISKSRLDPIVSAIVTVHPHEISALLHSAFCFFFILSAYFVVLPLRDEGAISLGLMNLPSLFVGSLVLTLIAAPVSSHIFSLPNLSKGKALVLIHRFFSASLVVFFILWQSSSTGFSKGFFTMFSTAKEDQKDYSDESSSVTSVGWDKYGRFYVSVRIGFFLWVALLNLITISSTWARIIDVMDSESGSRLFGFIGAGATLGQLFGSLFATAMAWLGPYLLLFAALLMEFAARLSEGINPDMPRLGEELSLIRDADHSQEKDDEGTSTLKGHSPKSTSNPHPWAIFDGMMLILSSSYLTGVALFLWLSAVISSFFYLQKVSIIAITVTSSLGRRKLFALINSFIAVFILAGQLTVTGHILTIAGVTIAICAAPSVAFLNLVAIAVWPTWVAIAVCETLRKVTTYVVTRPGRELLFTVVSQDEKYKAKICIDVFVQRLGDATAAGMYKLLLSTLHGKTSTISLYALPICLLWIVTAFYLGRRQSHLAQLQMLSMS